MPRGARCALTIRTMEARHSTAAILTEGTPIPRFIRHNSIRILYYTYGGGKREVKMSASFWCGGLYLVQYYLTSSPQGTLKQHKHN